MAVHQAEESIRETSGTGMTKPYLKEIRCPVCHKLLLYADGRGEIACLKCRGGTLVIYDTDHDIVKIQYRHTERR